jgi:hypothetical protein
MIRSLGEVSAEKGNNKPNRLFVLTSIGKKTDVASVKVVCFHQLPFLLQR